MSRSYHFRTEASLPPAEASSAYQHWRAPGVTTLRTRGSTPNAYIAHGKGVALRSAFMQREALTPHKQASWVPVAVYDCRGDGWAEVGHITHAGLPVQAVKGIGCIPQQHSIHVFCAERIAHCVNGSFYATLLATTELKRTRRLTN